MGLFGPSILDQLWHWVSHFLIRSAVRRITPVVHLGCSGCNGKFSVSKCGDCRSVLAYASGLCSFFAAFVH